MKSLDKDFPLYKVNASHIAQGYTRSKHMGSLHMGSLQRAFKETNKPKIKHSRDKLKELIGDHSEGFYNNMTWRDFIEYE